MEVLSRHIVITLILFLIVLFLILLSNRIHTKRQLRLQQLQVNLQEPSTTEDSTTATAGWRRVPGTFARTFRSPQGDVLVRIPLGSDLWHSRQAPPVGGNSSATRQDVRGNWSDTPSVWGIDLDTRGRGGDAILVPTPGGLVLSSTTRGPERWGRRRAIDEEAGFNEGECLPRYEEPPPGYEKVLEEDGAGAQRAPGSAGEGSSRQHSTDDIREDNDIPVPVPPVLTPPEPAVTRDRPVL